MSENPSLHAHQERTEDVTCEHGTAMDVHCCNCHSGFIFDPAHECPDAMPDAAETLKTVGRLAMLAVSDPHADSANYRKALREICNVAVAALPAHQERTEPPREGCINCGSHDGGYMTGFEGHPDEGAVGPFCASCWELLGEFYKRLAPPRFAESDEDAAEKFKHAYESGYKAAQEDIARHVGAPARAAEWQPLATCPNDNRLVLLGHPEHGVTIRAAFTATYQNGGEFNGDECRCEPYWYYTHWMPFSYPEPPLPPCALTGNSESTKK